MPEYVTCKLQCPVCATAFVADELHGAVPVGRDTDWRPLYEGPDPLLTHLHTCPQCRYSAYREGFETEPSDEDELIEEVDEDPKALPRPYVELPDDEDVADLRRYTKSGELAEGLVEEGKEPFGAVRYLLAARVHEFLIDDEPLGAAHYYLRAAWAARSTGDRALERLALRELLLRLSPVLEQGSPGDAEKLRLAYLAGEAARRAGDFGRAVDFFAQVERDADPDEDEGALLGALARRQTLLSNIKSDVNATVPADVGRRRRGADEDEAEDALDDDAVIGDDDDDDDDESGGSLN